DNGGRWITVAGALMLENPGDGSGGTKVYAVSKDDARNPEVSISVYDDGFNVISNRTARLQSSEDGNTLFNIAYTGDNGGEFSRYTVNGGNNFTQSDVSANISSYAGTSPRWAKLFDGDKTGIAVNMTAPTANNAGEENEDEPFKYYRGTATVLAVDLVNSEIANYEQFEIPLSEEEELQGHAIFRLDAPVLNKAGGKVIIGTWMRKYHPETGDVAAAFERLGTKSLVVDCPSLENPKIITSTVGHGDCSGYRRFNACLAEYGYSYQATQRDPKGDHIVKITRNNGYDNAYRCSLDDALGVSDVYIDAWRSVKDGIPYALYAHGGTDQGCIARADLN